jgi:multiple sugar transport system permease protein
VQATEGDRRTAPRDRWRVLPAVVVSVAFLTPLLFLVSGSFRPAGVPPSPTPDLIPWPPATGNYTAAFEATDLALQTRNSAVVALLAVPLAVLVASAAGFALTQVSRRLATAVTAASLVALMVPATALLVGRFTVFRALGLTDTFVPLVAPALLGMSPFYVLLFFWSYRRLPTDLFDAARLEGAGVLTLWWRVAAPLTRPVTVAVVVLAFAVSWGNLLDPLVYLYDPTRYTLPLGLRSLTRLDPSDQPVFLAAAVVATLPVVAVFLVAQRWFLGRDRLVAPLAP